MDNALVFLRRHWLMVPVVAILAILFLRADLGELVHTFVNVSWGWVSLAILANFASIMLKVASWKLIIDSGLDGVQSRWRDLTSALMIGFLVNLVIPARMGELARAYVIKRRNSLQGRQISSSTVLGTIVLERVFDGIAMAMIVIYGVTHMNLPAWADRGAIVLMVVSLVFAAALIVLESTRERLQARVVAGEEPRKHHSWGRRQFLRLRAIIARFSDGQRVLRSPGRVSLIGFTTAASWISQLFAVYFSLYAFHIGLAGIMGALLLLILINVAGALPATPGNVGIFQLATVIPLTVTYNISPSSALAFSIGLQIIEGSIGAGFGSAFLVREGLSFSQVRRESINELREEEQELQATIGLEGQLDVEPDDAPQLTRTGG
ncbi:MAG: lysylphosphatidylglycerol synthase transmembrane domain-containing protein [Thermoleophilia bacterium]